MPKDEELKAIQKQISDRIEYKKGKTFEKAEAHLRAVQNIKPDRKNYYEKGGKWFNKSYGSYESARSSFKIAMDNYKAK